MEKKTKLTISGSVKKPIKNIGAVKTQGKSSVTIEKKTHKSLNKSGSNFNKLGSFRPKSGSNFNRNFSTKPTFSAKSTPITNDFEKRKLAEQRATKRLKNEFEINDKKSSKVGTKKGN